MFNPNKSPLLPSNGGGREPKPKKALSAAVKKRLWLTAGLTALLLFVYYGCIGLGWALPVMIVYSAAFAILIVSYLAYNRAFVNKDVTVDMLPAEWSEEKKQAFVEGNRIRAEKSRWMVTLMIPFVVVFMCEAFYLFVWDGLLAETFANWGITLPGGGS